MVGFPPRRGVETDHSRRGVLSGVFSWVPGKGGEVPVIPCPNDRAPDSCRERTQAGLANAAPGRGGRLRGRKPVQADFFPVSGAA